MVSICKRFICRSSSYNRFWGVEKVLEIDLTEDEKLNFNNSIKAVQELFTAAKKLDPNL